MTFQFDMADRDSPTPPLHPFESTPFTSSRLADDNVTNHNGFFPTTPPDEDIRFVDQVATICKLDESRRDDLHSFREACCFFLLQTPEVGLIYAQAHR